ncbi:hypothetical protein [Prevotella sp. KH2C16]|uniref:hypothetical protein n=1 Tax=Prevotella sp. KH2C16 TaxID=1855325 RepID=UPI0008E04589|nr:hypothetical protein [Prevotella sp. KH2C16]SFF99790.1 hypothetical protein SAMN05216383_103170 [Prevotella sp. KH2C16]
MKKELLFIIILVALCYSCGRQKEDTTQILTDSIVVSYFRGYPEFNISISFEKLKGLSERQAVNDTIELDSTYYQLFKDYIRFITDRHLVPNDSRFYLKSGEAEISMSHFGNDIDKQSPDYKQLHHTMYLLMWKAGYFNTLDEEDIKYNPFTKEYGIPKDYLYQQHPRKDPPEPFGIRKIIFILKK